MGVVVGEKITRGIERAIAARMPVVIVCCSGGARMMEGALSLMQMAKICGALARLDRARLPFISVLTDPTTGGVTASFAMLGDLNIAEPKALIGFAGPRVIEQTIRQKLPEGFQRSEFLLEKGMLDLVVDRREMKAVDRQRAALHGRGARPRSRRAGAPPRPRRRRRTSAGAIGLSCGSALLSLRPRAVRHQVRPREHLRDRRAPRPSRARVPLRPHRRHQRQGLGHGDGRRRAARRRPSLGALHVAASRRSHASGSSSTASRSARTRSVAADRRRARRDRRAARATARSTCSRRSSR